MSVHGWRCRLPVSTPKTTLVAERGSRGCRDGDGISAARFAEYQNVSFEGVDRLIRRAPPLFTKVVVAVVISAAALAGPIVAGEGGAANAAVTGYVPSTSVTVSGERVPGGVIVIDFSPGSFGPGEAVVVTVTGGGGYEHTERLVAGADGALRYEFRVPADGVGSYDVVATGVSSGSIGTARVDLVPVDAGAGASGALPSTGLRDPLLVAWVAGGVTVLAGAMVATNVQRRRQSARRYVTQPITGPRWPSLQ